MKNSGIAWMVFLFVPFMTMAQSESFNRKVHDPKSGKEILIGHCTRDSLQGSIFGEHFKKEYSAYQPGEEVMTNLLGNPELFRAVHVTIIMGTWCSDSQQQIPRFFKVTDGAQYFGNVTLICVDREKLAGGVSLEGMNIEKVPTLIFERKGKEIGRIIETPKASIEEDLFSLLSK